MIEDGDKVMVCVSGGKDSYALLDVLINLRRRAPVKFDLVAVNLDQKQPGFPEHVLPEYLKSLDIPFHIENQDTYSIVKRLVPEGKTMCSLCSRLRRGILYRVAGELGATKIALGHHRDDMLQTLFMNMFFGSRLKGMPPKLVSDDGRNIVIRPLAYVAEPDLERWAAHRAVPDHPLHAVRQPGEPAARADEEDAARVGAAAAGAARQHLHRDGQHRALAHDGQETLSVHHAPNDGRGQPGGRPRVRRRRGLRDARPRPPARSASTATTDPHPRREARHDAETLTPADRGRDAGRLRGA